jgi:hypothetical protein
VSPGGGGGRGELGWRDSRTTATVITGGDEGGKVVGHRLGHKRSVDRIRWTADDREKGGGVKIDRHVIHLSF